MAPWPKVGHGGLIRGSGPWLYSKLRAHNCTFWRRDIHPKAMRTRRLLALANVKPKIAAFYAQVHKISPPPLLDSKHVGGTIYLIFYAGSVAGLVNRTRDLYVGHTHQRVLKRFHEHLTAAWRIRRGLPVRKACTVDRLIARTAWDDWHIIMLEQFTVPTATSAKDPDYMLEAELRETTWARRLGTYQPHGLNMRGKSATPSASAAAAAHARSLVGRMPIKQRRTRFFASRIYHIRVTRFVHHNPIPALSDLEREQLWTHRLKRINKLKSKTFWGMFYSASRSSSAFLGISDADLDCFLRAARMIITHKRPLLATNLRPQIALPFASRALDVLHLGRIADDPAVIAAVPQALLLSVGAPRLRYFLHPNLRQIAVNTSRVAVHTSPLVLQAALNGTLACDCSEPRFAPFRCSDPQNRLCGHVITGDTTFFGLFSPTLPALFAKGLLFRPSPSPLTTDLPSLHRMLCAALRSGATTLSRRFGCSPDALDLWASLVGDRICAALTASFDPAAGPPPPSAHLVLTEADRKIIASLTSGGAGSFVLTCADKLAKNPIVVCLSAYLRALLAALEPPFPGAPPSTYTLVSEDADAFATTSWLPQATRVLRDLHLYPIGRDRRSVARKSYALPTFAATVKLHKPNLPFRNIAQSHKSPYGEISGRLSLIWNLFFSVLEKDWKRLVGTIMLPPSSSPSATPVRLIPEHTTFFPVLTHSLQAVRAIHGLNRTVSIADRIAHNVIFETYDVKECFTSIRLDGPDGLLHVLTTLTREVWHIALASDPNICFIRVPDHRAYCPHGERLRASFTAKRGSEDAPGAVYLDFVQVIDWTTLVLANSFVRVGNRVYHQRIGIPMGTPAAPAFTNAYLHSYERAHLLRSISVFEALKQTVTATSASITAARNAIVSSATATFLHQNAVRTAPPAAQAAVPLIPLIPPIVDALARLRNANSDFLRASQRLLSHQQDLANFLRLLRYIDDIFSAHLFGSAPLCDLERYDTYLAEHLADIYPHTTGLVLQRVSIDSTNVPFLDIAVRQSSRSPDFIFYSTLYDKRDEPAYAGLRICRFLDYESLHPRSMQFNVLGSQLHRFGAVCDTLPGFARACATLITQMILNGYPVAPLARQLRSFLSKRRTLCNKPWGEVFRVIDAIVCRQLRPEAPPYTSILLGFED